MVKKIEKISIIGLGYVGLPLAVGFSKKFKVVGYDINKTRIKQLNNAVDSTKEIINKDDLRGRNITFTWNIKNTKESDFYIITVPTPLTKKKNPDFSWVFKI